MHRHKWSRIGGCQENPGVFFEPGGGFRFEEICECGEKRSTDRPHRGFATWIYFSGGREIRRRNAGAYQSWPSL